VRSRILALSVLLVGLALPGAARAAEPPVLDSGALRVRVVAEPFALEVTDRADGEVLRTLAASGAAPDDPSARYGPLGYSFDTRQPIVNSAYLGYYRALEVQSLWFHARRVAAARREGAGLVLELETNDPLGHRLELRIVPAGEGVVTFTSRIAPGSGPFADRPSLSGAAFTARPGERFLGFGERSNAVDHTGREVFSWAEEGPFSSGEGEELARPFLPDFTFPSGPAATNFPVPWLVSSRGLGFLIDQTQRSNFRLASDRPDAWQAEAESSFFRFTVVAGPYPSDVVRRYSGYAGRQPRPARWIFGPWVQFADPQPERFRALDVPTTVAQTYTHYLPCGAGGDVAAEQARVDRHHALGYKITTYFNPHVCTSYQPVYGEAAANGWLVKNELGQPYLLSNPFTADQVTSEIDFTHPGGVALYQRLLDGALARGYDGWMEDFGEYTPTDSVFFDGRRGLEMHNRYPVIYHQASTEHTQRRRGNDIAVFIRSGFHGVQPHARVVWGGDPTEDWSCADGLCAAVHQSLSIGLTGVAYWGSDIGGFHAIANGRTSDELNIRWLQFGAVSGVMRTQANGYAFRQNRAERSQVWSPAVLPIWRRYAKLRTQLAPYVEAASDDYQRRGLPIARHLALVYPNDPAAVRRQTDFMFGPDLLAAPVVEEGARTRRLYVPGGRWVDLWRAVDYVPAGGTLRLGRATTFTGRRELTLPAPLGELPLLARAGALLPMLPADVDTLADGVGRGPGLVHAGDRADRLDVLAFPRGASSARLPGRERLESLEFADGRWRLRIRGTRLRTYDLQASMATLRRPFRPCRIDAGGRPLSRRAWRYDAAAGVLRLTVRARVVTVVVRRRCR